MKKLTIVLTALFTLNAPIALASGGKINPPQSQEKQVSEQSASEPSILTSFFSLFA